VTPARIPPGAPARARFLAGSAMTRLVVAIVLLCALIVAASGCRQEDVEIDRHALFAIGR
jgi:hypothetical protein